MDLGSKVALPRRLKLVIDSSGNDGKLALFQMRLAPPESSHEASLDYDEHPVLPFVAVPDEFALKLDHPKFAHDSRPPAILEEGELLG